MSYKPFKKAWFTALKSADVLLQEGSPTDAPTDLAETLKMNARRHLPSLNNTDNARLCLAIHGLRLELESTTSERANTEALENMVRVLKNAEQSVIKTSVSLCNMDVINRMHRRKMLPYFGACVKGLAQEYFDRYPADNRPQSALEREGEDDEFGKSKEGQKVASRKKKDGGAEGAGTGVAGNKKRDREPEDATGDGGKKKKAKRYVPRYKTGAFAILVALDIAERQGEDENFRCSDRICSRAIEVTYAQEGR